MTYSGSPNPDPGEVRRDEETLQRQREEKAEQDRLEEERRILEEEVPFWRRQKQLEGGDFIEDPEGPNYQPITAETGIGITTDLENKKRPHYLSIGLETGIGITTDFLTAPLLISPIPGSRPIYYGINFGVGYGANALAQWMRGDWDEFSQGEALSAGGYQTIPFGTAAKGLKGLRRATAKGVLGGATMAQLEVGIDERRRLTAQELMLSSILGGTVAGGLKSAELGGDLVGDVIRNPYQFAPEGSVAKMVGTTGGGIVPPPSGSSGKITDLNADKLSIDGLKKQLDDDISFELGYNPDKISKTLYKAKLKAADGTVMPSEIATPFVRHGEAFLKANPTKTLEEFPHLWWKGEAWVLKGRNRYKTVNGKRQFVRKEVQIERWTDRKVRAKLGRDARSLRVKEQSSEVKRGTFAYEKVKQLRERNIKREAAGLSPLRLRDSDLDHINALRSVDYYTEGMPENFKKLIYEDLGREGLFTGDHATNLKLREREVHRALWPELKTRLKLLGHKHTGFATPEDRYKYYKEVNPKTGVTRLEEYAEVVYAVEELGDDMMEELLNIAKQKKQVGKPKVAPSDPVKDALIKILGSEEDYKVFMDRLRKVPANMRQDFILEEIKYHE